MSRPKNAVLLVTVPPGWHPMRVHDVPPAIEAATIYARHLSLSAAITVAKTHNLAHLQKGTFHGVWAMVSHSLKRSPQRHGSAASVKGGAA